MVSRLGTAQGGLASSLDADTVVDGHSVEGATYAWTPQQLVDVLGPDDGAWVAQLTAVTPGGTFEHGTSTLQLTRDVWAGSGRAPSGEGATDDARRWTSARDRLRQARATRPQPSRDDKVVAAWNGLAVAALAEAGALLDRADLLDAARSAADLLIELHLVDGVLRRVSRDGTVGVPEGVLEDYADVIEGLLALHAATGESRWLEAAGPLVTSLLDRFWRVDHDGAPGFTDVPHESPDPLLHNASGGRVNAADPTDNAYPSGVFAAAGALLSWAALTGDGRCREVAEAALASARQIGSAAPRFAGWGLAVAEALVDGPREVAVVGAPDDPATAHLHLVALRATAPGAAIAVGNPSGQVVVPLLEHRPLVDGKPAAYVCHHFTCDAPVTDPAALAAALGSRA
jgi:uncharacterized protein YyaL (SSP411 family)